jgi:hypothetical protein
VVRAIPEAALVGAAETSNEERSPPRDSWRVVRSRGQDPEPHGRSRRASGAVILAARENAARIRRLFTLGLSSEHHSSRRRHDRRSSGPSRRRRCGTRPPGPLLKPPMECRAIAELSRDRLPLAPGLQSVDDAGQSPAISTRDRPPRACDGGAGNHGSTYFHTSSGTSSNLASMHSRDHAPLRTAHFQHVPGGALSIESHRSRSTCESSKSAKNFAFLSCSLSRTRSPKVLPYMVTCVSDRVSTHFSRSDGFAKKARR